MTRGGPPRHVSMVLPLSGDARAAQALAEARARAEPEDLPGAYVPSEPPRDNEIPASRPSQHQPKRCKSCSAEIFWARTEAGRAMPVDAAESPDGTVILFDRSGTVMARVLKRGEEPPPGAKRRRPHWTTCPEASAWRKRR